MGKIGGKTVERGDNHPPNTGLLSCANPLPPTEQSRGGVFKPFWGERKVSWQKNGEKCFEQIQPIRLGEMDKQRQI